MLEQPPLTLTLILLLSGFLATSAQSFTFNKNCNDQQHRELKCAVRQVTCDDESQFPQVNSTRYIPDQAHDIRVSTVIKATSNKKEAAYQLNVDISWQTPPNNSTALLYGFLLEMNSDDGKQHQCFLFDVQGSVWSDETIKLSPRLHFFTESLFRFSQNYEISIDSLPITSTVTRTAQKSVLMPHNPRSSTHNPMLPSNCTHSSHPFASQWAAGFRRVMVYQLTRTVSVEFIAAPPEYCFEQYEVRLMDESVMMIERSGFISLDDLREEIVNGTVTYIGSYNFSDVDVNKTYTPTVIPVETSTEGRCLCPVRSQHYSASSNVVCTCVNSESKKIRLLKIDAEKTICMGCNNGTTLPKLHDRNDSGDSDGFRSFLIIIVILLALIVFSAAVFYFYRRYRNWGKIFRIQLVHDRNRSPSLSLDPAHAQNVALLKPGLLRTANINVLIVYSHDSPEHDASVLALAEYLKETFNLDVHLDVCDQEVIERNLVDYLSSSVVNADFIIVVNSLGAAKRYQTKIQSNAVGEDIHVVERSDPVHLDHLFVSQIDMVLQHKNLISARFGYSTSNEVLPFLHGRLQYQIPENVAPLLSAIHGTSMKHDHRLNGFNPLLERLKQSVESKKEMIKTRPDWFVKSHHTSKLQQHHKARVYVDEQILPDLPVVYKSHAESEPLLESGVSLSSPSSAGSTAEINELDAGHLEDIKVRKITELEQPHITFVSSLSNGVVHDKAVISNEIDNEEASSSGSTTEVVENDEVQDQNLKPVRDHVQQLNNKNEIQVEHQIVQQTQLDNENKVNEAKMEPKWRIDPQNDSGLVSDADLQMISAS